MAIGRDGRGIGTRRAQCDVSRGNRSS